MTFGDWGPLFFSSYLRICLGTPQLGGEDRERLEQDLKGFLPKFEFRDKFGERLELLSHGELHFLANLGNFLRKNPPILIKT